MSNQDTKARTATTGQDIDVHQKPIASFGHGEKACLIKKGSADPCCILTFPQLLQAKLDAKDGQVGSQQNPVPLVVDSPVGRGIVLERRHDVDQGVDGDERPVNWIVLGEAEKAIRVYMTADGIVHWAERPKKVKVVVNALQCLHVPWGQYKEYTEVHLYGLLEEGKGKWIQQFVLNDDGTLSPMHSPNMVWGWEPAAIRKARLDKIAAFVIKHANWPVEVTPSSCQISKIEGGISPLTESVYSVECPKANFNPAKVVLKRYVNNNLRNRRMVAASNVFSQVGAAPAIIAGADNWVIEPFVGQKPEFSTEVMEQIAELAARLHSVPIDWFAPFRDQMRQKHPCLQNVPVGSMIWPSAVFHDGHLERYTAEEMRQLSVALPASLSEIGREVVSTHGDLHNGNTLLTTDDVLLAVDFEMSAVSQVRRDLMHISWESGTNGSNRRTFCIAYLRARGVGFNQSEVDRLAVDMILAAVVNIRLLWGLFYPKGSFAGQIEMKQALLELSQLKEAVEGLGDDLEKYALLVDETDVWVCIQNIDPLLDLCTKS